MEIICDADYVTASMNVKPLSQHVVNRAEAAQLSNVKRAVKRIGTEMKKKRIFTVNKYHNKRKREYSAVIHIVAFWLMNPH